MIGEVFFQYLRKQKSHYFIKIFIWQFENNLSLLEKTVAVVSRHPLCWEV